MDDENKNGDQKGDTVKDPLLNPFSYDEEVDIQLLDEIELGRISDSSSSEELLNVQEKSNLKVRQQPASDDRALRYCTIFFFLTTIGAILWALSEGGLYGQGLIRKKLLHESCSHWNGRNCAEGLNCLGGFCVDHLGNRTVVVFNNTCEVCPPPVRCPPQVIQKHVSFFDFNEFPSYYLRQNSSDPDLKLIKDVSYGACKELCSKSRYCTAVSYHGMAHECHLRKRRGYSRNDLMGAIAGNGNNFWTAAFKINSGYY